MLKCSLVSRHISNMTLTTAPTFHRPEYYNNYESSYPQGNPPPYSEYDNQLRFLATQSPLNDSGYWENTSDNAVRMLNEQMGPYVLNRRIYAIAYIIAFLGLINTQNLRIGRPPCLVRPSKRGHLRILFFNELLPALRILLHLRVSALLHLL